MSDTAVVPASQALNKQLGFSFISINELPTEQKQVLKDTVAKGTTDTELTYFLNVAFAQELDPFRKEVWCVKYGQNLMIQTSRDGFLKIAKRDPTFDRIQSAEVRDGDDFRMDPITGNIEHRITAKRTSILGAYAVITRKDGTKVSKYVSFEEYNDGSSNIWKDYPSAMICKCAESVLCKQFANVSGIMAEEMMDKKGVSVDSSPAAHEQQQGLKTRLVAMIEKCNSIQELEAIKPQITADMGKLFAGEYMEVMAKAKEKVAQLSVTVVEAPKEEPKAEQPKEPTDEEIADAERKGMQNDSTPEQ